MKENAPQRAGVAPTAPPVPSIPVNIEGGAARRLAPPAPPFDPAERRRSARRQQVATAWLVNGAGTPTTSGRTVVVSDLSLHGVGFTSEKPCDVGDRHWILITRGPMRLSTRLRIASVRPRDDGAWDIGGEFC